MRRSLLLESSSTFPSVFRKSYPHVPYQNSKNGIFHGVSIPLRILTSSPCLRRIVLLFTLLHYCLYYYIPFILCYICTLIVWRCCLDWFPFSTHCLESSKRLSTVFFLGVYVSMRACVWDVSECSSEAWMMVCHSAWDGTPQESNLFLLAGDTCRPVIIMLFRGTIAVTARIESSKVGDRTGKRHERTEISRGH